MASVQDLVKQILLAAHPVGSYYWSSEATDPGTLFGGTWEQVKDKFLYAVGDGSAAGDTGGEETHTLTVDEMPAHSHGRGTQNITGTWLGNEYTSAPAIFESGAIKREVEAGYVERFKVFDVSNASTRGRVRARVTLDASKGWTGTSESTGGGAAMSIMPPYITAFCWRRTA